MGIKLVLRSEKGVHRFNGQAPVVQRADNSVHRINHHPVDSVLCFVNIYIQSAGQRFIQWIALSTLSEQPAGFYLWYLRGRSFPPPPKKKILLSLQYISNYIGKKSS